MQPKHPRAVPRLIPILIILLFASMQDPVALAAGTTILVTSTDGGTGGPDCKLRDAITAANTSALVGGCDGRGGGPFAIELARSATYTLDAVDNADSWSANGLPIIRVDITINGHRSAIVRGGGAPSFRLFYVNTGGTLNLSEVTLSGGDSNPGGAVYNVGTLNITSCTIRDNHSTGSGGAIFSTGTLNISSSTLVSNSAHQLAGAIYAGGAPTVVNSTLYGNHADMPGGAISVVAGVHLTVINSTLVLNSSDSRPGGVSGYAEFWNTIIISSTTRSCDPGTAWGGYNLSDDPNCGFTYASAADIALGPLRNNHGPVETMALQAGSVAIDRGTPSCPSPDARGAPRPVDGDGDGTAACDIGALEFNSRLPTTTVLASTPNPSIRWQPVTITATVSADGSPITGSVSFQDGETEIAGCSAQPATDGQATCTTALLAAGTRSITADYSGDADFAPSSASALAQTVDKVSQSITFAPLPDKTYGDPDFDISASTSSGLVVQFTSSGHCNIAGSRVHLTGAGSCTVIASQNGNADYSPAAPVSRTFAIAKANVTLALSVAPNSGTSVQTFIATAVVSAAPGLLVPSGTVRFTLNSIQAIRVLDSNGVATLVMDYLSPDSYSLRAEYEGDDNYLIRTSEPTPLSVAPTSTALALALSPALSVFGQSVAFTATVNAVAGNSASRLQQFTPTGTVTFMDGATALGSSALVSTGMATLTIRSLAVGTHSISARYSGDRNFTASNAPVVNQQVNKAKTRSVITSHSPNPSEKGQPVIVEFAVTVDAPGTGTPTGTVSVRAGNENCSATLPSNRCSLTLSSAGAQTIIIAYSGDDDLEASTASVVHTVSLATCAPTLGQTSKIIKRGDQPYAIYLPLVSKNWFSGPDLIVQSITPLSNTVQVTLLNQGDSPVKDEFWVDLYINPTPVPKQANQVWSLLASHGAVWGVTSPALPLNPGATLILSIRDPYYAPSLSWLPTTLPAGTCLFAQADSADTASPNGAVIENHELTGGAYNNITGIQLAAPITFPSLLPSQPGKVGGPLPRRP